MTTLNFDVFWRDRGATQGLKKLSDQSARAERGMQRFRTAGALAGVAVGAAIGKFGVDSVRAYSEAQTAQAKLENAFRRFPKLADTNISALRGLNSELARKTKFDDDATASGQAVLAQFNLTGQQIQRLTPLLQDYAAKTGKDLPTAARDLGKATLGQGRALKNVGINFKDTGTAAGNFEQIMGGLRRQVGGFAEAEGKTAAGQLAILKNQFGELQEEAGSHLVPALTKVVAGTTKAVQAFGELAPGAKAAVSTIVLGGPGLAIAAVAIGKVGTAAKETSAALKMMGISAKGATIATAGIGAALGLAALAFGMHAEKAAKSQQVTEDFTEALKSETSEINKNVTAVAAKALQDQGAFDAARKLGLGLDLVTQAALGNADAQATVNAVTDEAIRLGLNSANVDANIRVDAANQLSDAVGGTSKSYQKAVGDARNMSEATGEAGKEMQTAGNKTAAAKRELDEWRQSAIKAARAAIGLSGSQIDYEQAVDDATQSVKENGKTLDVNTEKGRNNRRSLNNLASSSLAYREKLIEQGASQKRVDRVTDDARVTFIKTARSMGASERQAKELADKFGLLDKKIDNVSNRHVKIKFSTQSFKIGGVKYSVNTTSPSSVGRSGSRAELAGHPAIIPPPHGGGPGNPYLDVGLAKMPPNTLTQPDIINRWTKRYADEGGKLLARAVTRKVESSFSGGLPGGPGAFGRGQSAAIRAGRRLGADSIGTYPGHHPSMAKARDFMISSRGEGDRIAGHMWANRKAYGIWYVIWNRRIASQTRPGAGWAPYTRSNPHTDHVHVAWYDRGGMLRPGGMAANASGQPERVLSPAQTRTFDRMVKVMDRNGGTVVHQHFHLPNYVGSHNEIVAALTTLNRQGRLEVIKR